ncbi:MAG: phosphatase PAP2 family protein [Longimicrobiales bacterium]
MPPRNDPERRAAPRGRLRIAGDLLYRMLRFIARHVQGFYGAIAALLTVGLVVGIVAAAAFVLVGEIMLEGATQALDESVLRWMAAHRTELLDHVALEVTSLGNTLVVATMVLVVSVFLWLSDHRISCYLLISAVVGATLINNLLKVLYDRPRPSIVGWETDVMTYSFPSGHAMTAAVLYASVAYLVGRLEPTPALRRATWTFAVLVIVLVGASRVDLGVHYPSDVIGGFVAGTAWVALLAFTFRALKFFAPRKPDVEVEERDLHAEEERALGVRE